MTNSALKLTNREKRMLIEIYDLTGGIREKNPPSTTVKNMIDNGLILSRGGFYRLTDKGELTARKLKGLKGLNDE